MTSASRSAAASYAEPNGATVSLPAGSNGYGYNAFNERIWKSAGHGSFRYVYGPGSTLLGERRESDGQWSNYLWFNGQLVGIVRNNQLYTVHTDHLGRPELVTTEAKAAVWKASNFAFDRRVTQDTIGGLNLGFPGQYYDQETNLWYNVNRYYDARIGAYTQSDPIGLAGGLNTYAYVGGNPVSFVDPLGTSPLLVAGCAMAAWGGYQATINARQAHDEDTRAAESATESNDDCPPDEGAEYKQQNRRIALEMNKMGNRIGAYGPPLAKMVVGVAIASAGGGGIPGALAGIACGGAGFRTGSTKPSKCNRACEILNEKPRMYRGCHTDGRIDRGLERFST